MEEFYTLPKGDMLPEEYPAPAPGIYPPPEEGSVGNAAGVRSKHSRKTVRRRSKNALLLAVSGAVLCGVIYTAPMKPAVSPEPPVETTVAEPAAEPEPTPPPPAETAPVVLTDAERLVEIGTWKNSAENEWVHFNEDGTGWWYDGMYFGRMVWTENAEGSVDYEAGIAYLGPGLKLNDEFIAEQEGNCLHSTHKSGDIELLSDEDRFTCPGLRFGEGSYLPDDTAIDASVMDGVCGKTAAELLSGTSWHMVETSDLGIPVAPSEDKGVYTDMVYVESIDFAAGTFRLATRDDGLLWLEDWTVVGSSIYNDASDTLDVSFALADRQELTKADIGIDVDITFGFLSDMRPGNVEYNNMHFLWGRRITSEPTEVYLLITGNGIRLGQEGVDLYPDNYSLLASD